MGARILRRRMEGPCDPLGLYRELTSAASRSDTILFEGRDGTGVLMDRAAVRAECRGNRVRMEALNANGEALLAEIARHAAVEPEIVEPRLIELAFAAPESCDLSERLIEPAPLHAIRRLLAAAAPANREPYSALAIGMIGFEHGAFGEADIAPPAPNDLPDYLFWIADSLVLFEPGAHPQLICAAFGKADCHYHDAAQRLARLARACEAKPQSVPAFPPIAQPGFDADISDDQFAALVSRLKEEIAAGEVFQIVPSRTFRAPCDDPLRAFAALREAEPNSYRFFVRTGDFTLFGASPETSVRVSHDHAGLDVEVRPIAGTRPRGADTDEDARLEAELRLDGKELAEHMMLVDLARNDIARVSLPGTCHLSRLLDVERHARVMHLVSSVKGRLAVGLDAIDALRACLNVGTLSGAPKIRATELLAAFERGRRSFYGGAVGWIDSAGTMDMSVIIRSALVRDGIADVRAGAGVVHDSCPIAEAEETRRKASALLSVLGATAARLAA